MKIFLTAAVFLLTAAVLSGELLRPLPEQAEYDHDKAQLGKRLFFDTRLSQDDTISCAFCHDLSRGGVDRLPVSIGIQGREGSMNAPTVLNARYNLAQFWDGSALTLKEQALKPMITPHEMGNTHTNIVRKLSMDSDYLEAFTTLYPDGITIDNVADAIAEFEKALVTPSPFDDYLQGDETAITQQAKQGHMLFFAKGCISCHNGINIGGNLYQKFGVFREYISDQAGRFDVTREERDRYFFKVPTLRNVALTMPYFHDGSVQTLEEAVSVMAEYQLGRSLQEQEVAQIIAFLESLTGELPAIAQEQAR